MPNWCENTLKITGDKEAIAKFKAQALREKTEESEQTALSFDNFIPMPKEFLEIQTGGRTIGKQYVTAWRIVDGKDVAVKAEEIEELKKKYGAEDWHSWAVKNWGVKWDVEAHLYDQSETSLSYTFDTAWCQPANFIETVAKMFPTLHFEMEYKEPGAEFQGTIIAKGDDFTDMPEDYEPEEWELDEDEEDED